MTQQQFIEEVKRLSVAERIALMEVISRSLLEEFEARGGGAVGLRPTPEQAAGLDCVQDGVPLSRRLYGIIEFDGGPPTDEEVKDMYAEHLSEKYS